MSNFRDHLIAASLKLINSTSFFAEVPSFPRSSDRGLIEAMNTGPRRPFINHFRDHLIAASLKRVYKRGFKAPLYDFRDHLIAASLKPRTPRSACSTSHTFPRSSDRGLIEAFRDRSRRERGVLHFRDHLIAASLKRHRGVQLVETPQNFRDHLIAASLKLILDDETQEAYSHFRDHLIAASLKRMPVIPGALFPTTDFRDHLIAASLKPY